MNAAHQEAKTGLVVRLLVRLASRETAQSQRQSTRPRVVRSLQASDTAADCESQDSLHPATQHQTHGPKEWTLIQLGCHGPWAAVHLGVSARAIKMHSLFLLLVAAKFPSFSSLIGSRMCMGSFSASPTKPLPARQRLHVRRGRFSCKH